MPNTDHRHREPPVGGPAFRWGVTGGVLALAGLGYLAGGPMVGVALLIVAVFTINGVWLGAAEQAAGLLAMIAGVLLSGVVGPMLEPAVASVGGTGGIVAQLVARGLAVLAVALPLGIALGVVLRLLIKKTPPLARWNTVAGSLVGAAEGTLVALFVMWIPILLGPVAVAQVEAHAAASTPADRPATTPAAPQTQPPSGPALAEMVAGWERALRASALGALAAATAPTRGAEVIALTTEFAEITRDDAAMQRLLDDPVMLELNELPSVQFALDRLRDDPQIRAALQGEAITPDDLWMILQSNSVLNAIEDTGAMRDVARRGPDIAAAIARARSDAPAP